LAKACSKSDANAYIIMDNKLHFTQRLLKVIEIISSRSSDLELTKAFIV
jgi:hypothetical protein